MTESTIEQAEVAARVRATALEGAMRTWVQGETTADILARATAFLGFLEGRVSL